LTEEDKEGIHVLEESAKIGDDPIKYLELDDEIINFELTSNRSDLLSVIGMAYEIGAIYDKEVTLPTTNYKEINKDITKTNSLKLETSNCSLYVAKLVEEVEIKESPAFIKSRLIASGIRPINNVVDISNYVMLEYGQPLHFFDADKLGNDIIVRMAKKGEEIITLDQQKRVLDQEDIVIATKDKAIAIAGVMGGLDTEVTLNTKRILIEGAVFNSQNIRQTSNKILRSEASNRFEKGIDSSLTEIAVKRACYLLSKYANAKIIGNELIEGKITNFPKTIKIDLDQINRVLGMNLTKEDVDNVFRRLKFDVKNNNITVPSRRLDINIKEDLIEEVGRIYGYDNLEGILPKVKIKRGSYSRKAKLIKEIENQMISSGLNQVITYSLVSDDMLSKFVLDLKQKATVSSPMSEDKKHMRQSLIPSLINVFEYNSSHKNNNVSIFEIGSIYYKEQEYIEETYLSGLMYGNYVLNEWQKQQIKVDFYLLKGIIESLLKYLGFSNRYSFEMRETSKDYNPSKSATILVDNIVVGCFGQVHPLINKKGLYVFEINLEKLFNIKVRGIRFREITKYPSVNKDLSFSVKKEVESSILTNIIKKKGGRNLVDLNIFDCYEGENIESGNKSLTYSLTFQDATKTMTDDEVIQIIEKIIEEVEKTGAKLRSK
jgi:phenylalanyl-tRNA synthetase beta chain